MPPVDLSVLIDGLKRSEAEHTKYLIARLQSDGKSLESKADTVKTFVGPQQLKRLEASPEQQLQAVDILYWMAYCGTPAAYKALRSKLEEGGLEETVETRISQALRLLDEQSAKRKLILSDFADAGSSSTAPIEKVAIADQFKQKIRQSISSTLDHAGDVTRDLATNALCRMFGPATNRICQQLTREWSQSDHSRRSVSLDLIGFHPSYTNRMVRASTFNNAQRVSTSGRPMRRANSMRLENNGPNLNET